MKLYELAEKYRSVIDVIFNKDGEKIWGFKVRDYTNEFRYRFAEDIANIVNKLSKEMDVNTAFEYIYECLRWLDDYVIKDCETARKLVEGRLEYSYIDRTEEVRVYNEVINLLCERLKEEKVEIE